MCTEVKCQESLYQAGHDVDKSVLFKWLYEDNGIII